MKVITSNPLMVNKTKISTNDMYISADGISTEPTDAMKAKAARKGVKWDKAKGWVSKANDLGQKTGATDFIKNKLNEKFGLNQGVQPTTVDLTTPPPIEEPKMSTKKKIIIGVSVALVIGVVVFLATRKTAKLKTA